MRIASLVALCGLIAACGEGPWTATLVDEPLVEEPVDSVATPAASVVAVEVVTVGAETLADTGFAALDGRRVALIANQTSLVRGVHLIDVLHRAPNVDLVAVFAPEHGVRGTAGAGAVVEDEVDVATGVPVLSLYGATRVPTPEMLEGVDTVVYDLQGVGARFFTYVSTMGLAMQAAAEADVSFVVLDRPDPSGRSESAGFVADDDLLSFIGRYPVPSAYAMTPGELARAIVGERWLEGLESLELTVVEMQGWQRGMRWADTRLGWVPPSPGLQTHEAALVYQGTVLFEATSLSYGGGTEDTFMLVGAPWADGEKLAAELAERALGGVRFEPAVFTPGPLPGRTSNPRLNGETLSGVRVVVTDELEFEPVSAAIHLIEVFRAAGFDAGEGDVITRPRALDLLSGSRRLREMFEAGASAAEIVASWADEVAAFDDLREQYLLYD